MRRVLAMFAQAVEYADAIDRDGLRPPVEAARDPAPTTPRPPSARSRGPKPFVRSGTPIDSYSDVELRGFVQWVLSDGRLLTDEDIIAELTRELGFQRRGSRIVEALTKAIRGVRHA